MSRNKREETSDMPLAGVSLAATGISSTEEYTIKAYLRSLGGTYHANMLGGGRGQERQTTFLIVKRVGSPKYIAARKLGIPTITLKWLADCSSANARIDPKDYLAGPFYGLTICCTQMPLEERNELEAAVERNGGTFVKDFDAEIVSHLVAERPEGDKYAAAKSFGITVITYSWILACIEQKRWLVEQPYMLTTDAGKKNGSSAANNAASQAANSIAAKEEKARMMAIAVQRYEQQKKIDEATRRLADKNAALLAAEAAAAQAKLRKEEEDAKIHWEELPHPRDVPYTRRKLLSTEKLFFTGFTQPQLDYLVTLSAVGGTVRSYFLTNSVTKIILGEYATETMITEACTHSCGAPVVRLRWLIDSLVPGHLARFDAIRMRKRAIYDEFATERRRLNELAAEEAKRAVASMVQQQQLQMQHESDIQIEKERKKQKEKQIASSLSIPTSTSMPTRLLFTDENIVNATSAVDIAPEAPVANMADNDNERTTSEEAASFAKDLLNLDKTAQPITRRRSTGVLRASASRSKAAKSTEVIEIGEKTGPGTGIGSRLGVETGTEKRILHRSDSNISVSNAITRNSDSNISVSNANIYSNANTRKRPQPTVVDWSIESSEFQGEEEDSPNSHSSNSTAISKRKQTKRMPNKVEESQSQWVVWD